MNEQEKKNMKYYLPVFGQSYNFCLAEQMYDEAIATYEKILTEKKQQFLDDLKLVPELQAASFTHPSNWQRGEFYRIMRSFNGRTWECVQFKCFITEISVDDGAAERLRSYYNLLDLR